MKFHAFLFLSLSVCSFNGYAQTHKTVAVVELFTAEGCSSCPPADVALDEMTTLLNREGKNVLPLSFHVTYWNQQGWKDPYSREEFTDRQKKYVAKLKSEALYTPQAIVNGAVEFVGSNTFAFREEVTRACKSVSAFTLKGEVSRSDGTIKVIVALGAAPKNLLLNVALVEIHVQHFIPRGENKGVTLKHRNVVRAFSVTEATRENQVVLTWPEDLLVNNASVILYLQNSRSLKIVAATEVSKL